MRSLLLLQYVLINENIQIKNHGQIYMAQFVNSLLSEVSFAEKKTVCEKTDEVAICW